LSAYTWFTIDLDIRDEGNEWHWHELVESIGEWQCGNVGIWRNWTHLVVKTMGECIRVVIGMVNDV